jgi:hypothetical protein
MKVKHTKNGNVKLAVSPEQLERLRSILVDTYILESEGQISKTTQAFGDDLNRTLKDAGIGVTY